MLTGFFTVSLPAPTIVPALQGLAIGMVLLLGFTLPPLLSLRKVPTLRVLRRDLDPFDGVATFAYFLGFVTLAALIIWRSGDVKLGSIAVGGFVVALGVAALAGWLVDRSGAPQDALMLAAALFALTMVANLAFRVAVRRLR
jgi:putative ABC transport system permease protein